MASEKLFAPGGRLVIATDEPRAPRPSAIELTEPPSAVTFAVTFAVSPTANFPAWADVDNVTESDASVFFSGGGAWPVTTNATRLPWLLSSSITVTIAQLVWNPYGLWVRSTLQVRSFTAQPATAISPRN